jgi:hypothetical protein
MKKAVIILVLGIFLSILAYFLLSELSPFKQDKLQELIELNQIEEDDFDSLNIAIQEVIDRGLIFQYLSENAYIVGAIILASLFCVFTAAHLFIDRIVFRNHFERPSLVSAFRRGFILVIVIALSFYSHLSHLEWYFTPLIILSGILIEVVYKLYFIKDNDLEVNPGLEIPSEIKEDPEISEQTGIDINELNPYFDIKLKEDNIEDLSEHSLEPLHHPQKEL